MVTSASHSTVVRLVCVLSSMHNVNPNLPFGGVGSSGMGSYHGPYGYKLLSHSKAVLHKSEWLDAPQRYNNTTTCTHAYINV